MKSLIHSLLKLNRESALYWSLTGKWVLLIIAMVFLSKNPNATVIAPHGKVTKGPHVLYSVELEFAMEPTARQDLESSIITDRKVQSCLREALKMAGDDFVVEISGQVTDGGKLRDIAVETVSPPPLKDCLTGAVSALRAGSGPSGAFHLHLARARTPGNKSKTFLLDLNEPRKLE